MYLITNRQLDIEKTGLKIFGDNPNENGPNELRIVHINDDFDTIILPDILTEQEVAVINIDSDLHLDTSEEWPASLMVAANIYSDAIYQEKSILFFTHGYNNDVKDVVKAAFELERLYNVIVVPFSWPANGGGMISGTTAYRKDKADARASAGAMNSLFEKIQNLHITFTQGRIDAITSRLGMVTDKDEWNENFTKLMEKECGITINLLCHSMGNYVLKHALMPSVSGSSDLVFDNIILCSADVNAEDHEDWVDKLDVRNRVYIMINERDAALRASRIKPGAAQRVRLGHTIKNLFSNNASYIDVTSEAHVGAGHTYFKGKAMRNKKLWFVFNEIFKGGTVEEYLNYRVDNNTYRLT